MSELKRTWPPDWWFGVSQCLPVASSWIGAGISVVTHASDIRLRAHTLRRVGFLSWTMTAAALAVVMALCATHSAWADAAQPQGSEDNVVVVTKEITGQVSAINPKDRFLTLVYQRDKDKGVEYELLLTLSDKVELRYKRDLNELKYGDTVTVTYAEKQQDAERRTPDGKIEYYTKVLSREAQVIAFLRPQMTGAVKSE